jgi:hypothetical protein
MMAARNNSTDTKGPRVAKRSWRAGGWLRHQRAAKRCKGSSQRLVAPFWSSWKKIIADYRSSDRLTGKADFDQLPG